MMGTSLSQDLGVVLIINVIGTVLALAVLIWTLGPTSGAHFNPAVTLVAAFRREVNPGEAVGYVCAQVVGALVGVGLANLMYSHAWWEVSSNTRSGAGLLLGEVIATAGLLWVIGMLTRTGRGHLGPLLVPAWIAAAFVFTSSTSFANPAVTIGRMFTDSFTGISPSDVLPFVLAQLVGAALGAALTEVFYPRSQPEPLDLPEPVHSIKEKPHD